MAKTDFHENAILNTARGTALTAWDPYVAFFTAVADAEAGTITEVAAGDGYARELGSFSAPSAGAMSNDGELAFGEATADKGTCTHFGLFDAVTGGNLRYVAPLDAPFDYDIGVLPRFAAGALDVTED
jgi:hypothetical protein